MPEDLLLKTAELGRRIDPEFLSEHPARRVEGCERIALATCPIAGQHEVAPQSFTEGMVADQ